MEKLKDLLLSRKVIYDILICISEEDSYPSKIARLTNHTYRHTSKVLQILLEMELIEKIDKLKLMKGARIPKQRIGNPNEKRFRRNARYYTLTKKGKKLSKLLEKIFNG